MSVMKKTLLIVVVILAVLIALPIINLIRWSFQTKKPLDIVIVDKTVPTLERQNHRSFTWILTNERFVRKENNSSYSYLKDYYGFIPTRPLREFGWTKKEYRLTDLKDLPAKNDAVYFTDTYGVFSNDWYKGLNRSRRSRTIYGGLDNTDNLLIKEMKDNKKLVLLEYNIMDHPTSPYESVRIQDRLGITFTGWTGKYFHSLDSLDPEFPIWMTSMYRKHNKAPWTFTKSGIVLLKTKEIIVLEEGTHLTNPLPFIITDSAYCRMFNLAPAVAFDKWFDIINPLANNVVSNFRIETTALGDSLLQDNNLMNLFPAVIQEPADRLTYYFSGDFSNNSMPMWSARIHGFEKLKIFLYSDKQNDTRRFFWLYYKPLISGILNDHYKTLNAK